MTPKLRVGYVEAGADAKVIAEAQGSMIIGLRGDVGAFEIMIALPGGEAIYCFTPERAVDLAQRIVSLAGVAESARTREEATILMSRLAASDPSAV